MNWEGWRRRHGSCLSTLGSEGHQALQRGRERGVIMSPAQSGFDCRLSDYRTYFETASKNE